MVAGAAAVALGSSFATLALHAGSRLADRTVGTIVTSDELDRRLSKLQGDWRAELGSRPDHGRRDLYTRVLELEAAGLGSREQIGREVGLRTALQVGCFYRSSARERMTLNEVLSGALDKYETAALEAKEPFEASRRTLRATQTPRSD